jgi:hypothetical protein
MGLDPPDTFAPIAVFGFDDVPVALDGIGVDATALRSCIPIGGAYRRLNPFPFLKLVRTVKEAVRDGIKPPHLTSGIDGSHAGGLAVFGAGRWVRLGKDEEFFLDWVEHGHIQRLNFGMRRKRRAEPSLSATVEYVANLNITW